MDMEESRLIRFTNLAGGALKSIQALKGMKMAPYGLSAAHTDLLCHLAHRGRYRGTGDSDPADKPLCQRGYPT